MIIVSQEKNRIINFDNILQIYITIDEDDKDCYIQYEDCNNSYEGLGKYNTEERAKEVLAKIYKVYSDFTLIKNTRDKIQRDLIIGEQSKYFDVFEMPKE